MGSSATAYIRSRRRGHNREVGQARAEEGGGGGTSQPRPRTTFSRWTNRSGFGLAGGVPREGGVTMYDRSDVSSIVLGFPSIDPDRIAVIGRQWW